MSDLMNWFYSQYIKPHIDSQPKDDGEFFRFDLLDNDLCPHQKESLEQVLRFYTVQGFRLGLKTGLALGEDLSSPQTMPAPSSNTCP